MERIHAAGKEAQRRRPPGELEGGGEAYLAEETEDLEAAAVDLEGRRAGEAVQAVPEGVEDVEQHLRHGGLCVCVCVCVCSARGAAGDEMVVEKVPSMFVTFGGGGGRGRWLLCTVPRTPGGFREVGFPLPGCFVVDCKSERN